jgi:hypothetical protein
MLETAMIKERPPTAVMRPLAVQWIAWAAALLPFVAVHAAFWLSVNNGYIAGCMPYWDGCTSISGAARRPGSLPLFRALMLPYAALLMAFCWLAAAWTRLLAPQRRLRRAAMLLTGVIGAGFLIVYVTTLGEDTELSRWLRRYGINVYFSFTVLAQMLLASQVLDLPALPRVMRALWITLCALLLGLGLAAVPLQFVVEDRGALLNAIAWQYGLLMILTFPLAAWGWRRTGFALQSRLAHALAERNTPL